MYLEGPMVGFIDKLASSSPEPGAERRARRPRRWERHW